MPDLDNLATELRAWTKNHEGRRHALEVLGLGEGGNHA
jgi:hypothetical protein